MIRKLFSRLSSRRQLRGSWLHRVAGEKLFRQEYWQFSRELVAGGLAVGVFWGLTPTLGVQMVLSGITALYLRLNVPACLLGCWITNPMTAPVIYTLEYKLGLYLLGNQLLISEVNYCTMVQKFMHHARPLWAGCMVAALVVSALTYVLVYMGWTRIEKVLPSHKKAEHDGPHPA